MSIPNLLSAEVIGAFITGVVGPLLVLWYKTRKENEEKSKKDILADELKLSNIIQTKIEEIRDEIDADRVWIIQFHNGGNFYPTGRSIQKFSMFYETVSANAHSIQSIWQNIPINLFSRSTNQLLEHDKIMISSFEDNDIETFGLKYMAEENKSKSMFMFALRTIDGKFVGMLGIDFTKEEKRINYDQLNNLAVEIGAIGGVLMNHLVIKNR